MPERQTLGDVLKRARLLADLSQAELAKRMGITPSYVSHLESGRREPSLDLLRRFSAVTGAPVGMMVAAAMDGDDPLPMVPVETGRGEPLAFLVLPMRCDAFADVLRAVGKHYPDVRVREGGRHVVASLDPPRDR